MAEMKSGRDKKSDEDIKFSRDELTADDNRESDFAREKRNKPIPQVLQDQAGGVEKVVGWPYPEDRLPAVMVADKESDHDYKEETYSKIDDELRDKELAGNPGDVARAEVTKALAEAAAEGKSANEIQAPPSPNAVTAAEGGGAPNTPLPAGRPAAPAAAPAAPAPAPRRR